MAILSFTAPDVAVVGELNIDGTAYAVGTSNPNSTVEVSDSLLVSSATYTTLAAAYAAGYAINPNFDGQTLFGGSVLTADDVSDSVLRPAIGDAVTLSSTYTASQSGTTTFTYTWYKDDLEITGATSGSISTSSFTEDMRGRYRCEVVAYNSTKGITSEIESEFFVLPPLPTQTAAFAIGGA